MVRSQYAVAMKNGNQYEHHTQQLYACDNSVELNNFTIYF